MFPRKKEKPKEQQQPASAEQEEKQTENDEQSASGPQKQAEQMQKQIEDLKKEKDEIFAKLQRVAADYDNFQKRSARQIADSVAYEKEKIIKSLLPALDNFEHALANSEGADADAILMGVRIVYDHILDALKAQGVEQIAAAGKNFDPAMHEAIVQQSDPGKEDGVVLGEVQKGYKLNGRVIRASRVVVNKVPAAEEQWPADEDENRDTQ